MLGMMISIAESKPDSHWSNCSCNSPWESNYNGVHGYATTLTLSVWSSGKTESVLFVYTFLFLEEDLPVTSSETILILHVITCKTCITVLSHKFKL